MRNQGIRLLAIASFAACGGSNDAKPVDAAAPPPDAAPDAAPDAPPDGPSVNLACAGMAFPTMAPAAITLGGITGTLAAQPTPIANAQVEVYKRGTGPAVATVTSDTNGVWSAANLQTAMAPFDGYIHASSNGATVYRSSYIYPPQPFAGDFAAIPTPLVSKAVFDMLGMTQNDTLNGVLVVIVNDCGTALVGDATVTAKQNGASVGTVINLGIVGITGVYFVLNVPDGDTVVNATLNGTAFHEHTVRAFKKSAGGADANGTITATIVRPGPLP